MTPHWAGIVPVLLWHAVGDASDGDPFRVTRTAFRHHLDLVARSGRVPLTAAEYGDMLRGRHPTPDGAVVLTFDDGFADLVDEVLPALGERGLRATAFVTSGYVGRPGMLSRAGLAELACAGAEAVEIGAHTVTHPHLDVLPPAAAQREIAGALGDLEDWLDAPVTSFAYPHGSHSARTRRLVRRSGFRTAHAVRNALSHPEDDVFAVSRVTVRADTGEDLVAAVLQGRGAPLGWRRERLRTWGFRQVRRGRHLLPAARS
jgi:peptidoglycan/xylan/chitin deacetylase (PgdA/CDA1 family)